MRISSRCLQSFASGISKRPHTIGFIGLGRMGNGMANNLFSKRFAETSNSPNPQSDLGFVVCDADLSRAQSFAKTFSDTYPGSNITVAVTPAEVATFAQTLLTMLPSSPQVQEVYQGDGGIFEGLLNVGPVHNTLCIDSTTLDVDVARAVAEKASEAGAEMVDAPVSGGVTGANAGTLSFLVGGKLPVFERASPILHYMGSRIIHCGDSSAGVAAKICNNLVLGVQQIVVAEAMLLGQKLNLDPATVASVINSSTGACWASSVNNPVRGALVDKSPPCDRNFEGGFLTSLMLKDMELATNSGMIEGIPMPMAEVAQKTYADMTKGHPNWAKKDFSSVYQYLTDRLMGRDTVKSNRETPPL